MATEYSARRTIRRYLTMLVLVVLLIGGWSSFWFYATGKAETALDGWRAREAKAGHIYECGKQSFGGFPFRFELNCDAASALFQSNRPPVELKARGILVAAQIYQPDLLISEIHGPLTVASPGAAPSLVVNWKLFQTSVRGTPSRPERVSLVLDKPVVDSVTSGSAHTVLHAEHAEIHGRLLEGSATDHPVIEVGLRLRGAIAPDLRGASERPVDAVIDTVLHGLKDFEPKPWHERFRQMQADGGSIEVTRARVQQGATVAVGAGSLSINPDGRLQGQLSLTVAGIEPFLKSIGAAQMVQTSPALDKLAGALDRLSPGLGNAARQQIGDNLSAGISMLGKPTTLEGQPAVTLPLRFDDGRGVSGTDPAWQRAGVVLARRFTDRGLHLRCLALAHLLIVMVRLRTWWKSARVHAVACLFKN